MVPGYLILCDSTQVHNTIAPWLVHERSCFVEVTVIVACFDMSHVDNRMHLRACYVGFAHCTLAVAAQSFYEIRPGAMVQSNPKLSLLSGHEHYKRAAALQAAQHATVA